MSNDGSSALIDLSEGNLKDGSYYNRFILPFYSIDWNNLTSSGSDYKGLSWLAYSLIFAALGIAK